MNGQQLYAEYCSMKLEDFNQVEPVWLDLDARVRHEWNKLGSIWYFILATLMRR